MVDCWAEVLRDCGAKQSKEHYISRAVMASDYAEIRGFPWQREESRTVPTASLVRGMLCKRHNEMLSPVDEAGAQAFRCLCRFAKVAVLRERNKAKLRRLQQYQIDGSQLERWLLKTTINIAYQRKLFNDIPWRPPGAWVEIAFGRRVFPRKTGLYLAERDWQTVRRDDRKVGIQLMDIEERELVGARFELNDFGFLLSMTPLGEKGLQYRPRRITERVRCTLQQVVNLSWQSVQEAGR